MKVYDDTLNELSNRGIDKLDLIIAFGGGVIGDLAGFIAGTIFRGIRFVNIPTTLLAMSDSSIGGKTGINTDFGKNLVGVYKQPLFVVIDTFFLKTLDHAEYSNGIAEIIKAALIGSLDLTNDLLEGKKAIEEIIYQALMIKRAIVLADPYEENIRMFLNFGHTFGHAIEKHHQYKIKHGYCVAEGMDLAIRFGIKKGLTNKTILATLTELYKKYNLKMFKGNSNLYLEDIKYDKKNLNKKLHFVVISEIGSAEIIQIEEGDLNDLSS